MSQATTPVDISSNDFIDQVFGKEHPSQDRCVGDRVCLSQVFGSSNPRFCSTSTSMNVLVQSSVQELKNEVHEFRSELKAKDANIKTMATLLAKVLTNSNTS